jgi:AraC family ethanolamine operon transcriptional activator
VVFSVPEAELAQHIVELTNDDPEQVLQTHGVVRLTPRLANQIREAASVYLDIAAGLLTGRSEPSLVSEMANFAVEVVAIALVSTQAPDRSIQTLQRRSQLIRKAEGLSVRHGDQALRIGELCDELGVSERTLRHAFRELTGLSSLDYLKLQRLNRVYRTLRGAYPAGMLIKEVAYANGFNHLGQFSRDYKQLFAESPLQTLRRI